MALENLFEDLKAANTRIFSVRQAQSLSSEVTPGSLGYVFMPPIIARNMNFFAENKSVTFGGRPVDFYFSMVPPQPFDLSREIIEQQVTEISSSATAKLHVFVPRAFVPKVICALGNEKLFYWPIRRYDEEYSSLFELCLNKQGMVVAKLTNPYGPLVFLD
jgi:hypothetical protein